MAENKFKDLNCVSIRKPVRALAFGKPGHYKNFPAGSIGTVIDSYTNAYWVEFSGEPAKDGLIYEYYSATIAEEDLELYSEH
jgi:hypothetical protein